MSANQPPQHAPDEAVAQVLALTSQNHSAAEAARLVGVSERSAQRWVNRAKEVSAGNKPILDKWTRRVDQALDLIEDGLNLIEADESGQTALKHLPNLNMIAGTGTDKLQRESQGPAQIGPITINVFGEPPPTLIEGEATEVNDA